MRRIHKILRQFCFFFLKNLESCWITPKKHTFLSQIFLSRFEICWRSPLHFLAQSTRLTWQITRNWIRLSRNFHFNCESHHHWTEHRSKTESIWFLFSTIHFTLPAANQKALNNGDYFSIIASKLTMIIKQEKRLWEKVLSLRYYYRFSSVSCWKNLSNNRHGEEH